MAGKGDGDGWTLFVDMRDAPWSVSGWQVGDGWVVVGWTKVWPSSARSGLCCGQGWPRSAARRNRRLLTSLSILLIPYKWATSDRLRMILGVFSFCTARNPHIICLIFSRVTFFESNIFVNTNLLQTQNVLLPTNIPPFTSENRPSIHILINTLVPEGLPLKFSNVK